VHKHKSEIQPQYAKLSPKNITVAYRIIEFYTTHIGEQKKVLTTYIAELENQGYDYRFVRALSLLLDRKSRFFCKSKTNPSDLRRRIFQATQTHGIPTTPQKRQQIITTIATETSLPIETIEDQLYADLDAELILEKIEPPTPTELLQQYNLSLTQTLLFESSELNFNTSGNWQQIFYTIKKLGLIYEATQQTTFNVKIDGPSSLFKLTKRYGINIAKLLPAITTNQNWTINAKILWKYTNEICNFNIESQKHAPLLKPPKPQPLTYDSTTEENFANQFQAVNSGWTLKREPEPIITGNHILIPDFSLQKAGLKIYLEIVGFWTEEYLRRKAEKLQHVNNKMIIIVHESLACEKLTAIEKRPQLHFIYYKDKIPLAPILRYLQNEFEEIKTKEIQTLQKTTLTITEPVLLYTEIANKINLSVESIQTVLSTKPPTGYVPISNGLVSTAKLEQISNLLKDALKQSQKLTLSQATAIIETQGVTDISSILNLLTYKIKWNGINSEQAEIIPPKTP